MSNRKRVNMTLTPEQYAIIEKIRKEYHFRTVCDVCTTITTVCINLIVSGKYNQRKQETSEEYIARMFDTFAEAEPTPERADVYRRHNNTDNPESMGSRSPTTRPGLLPRNNGARGWAKQQIKIMMEEYNDTTDSADDAPEL